ncbi:MAG: ABC transporter ATP-binding protein [Chitinophagaceae bacterium]|nr:ABC transporter ATP-binding protein [Chitinophagaceae bacterium]
METNHLFRKIWNLLLQDKSEIFAIYFYAILSGLVQLSVPIGVQAIIGFVLGASMVTSLYVLIFLVVLGVLFVGIFQMNQMKLIEKIQQQIFARYAFDFAEKIPRLDLLKTDQYYLPEKINKFFDTINVQKGLSKILLDVPTASIQILFGLILLALYHPVFIVFGFVLITILWVILKYTSKKGLSTSLLESKYKYKVVAWFEEMARIIKSFKFSQGSHLNLKRTDENVSSYLNARTAHFKILLFQYRALVAFKVAIITAMLSVGTYLLLEQQLNIGEFIATEIVIITVISAVEKLISSLDSVYDTLTGLEKLAIVTESPLEKEGTFSFQHQQEGMEIEFRDFGFEYPDGKKALQHINMHIKPNAKICISGGAGAGKSTLIKVLSGSYRAFEGTILLNKIPIGNYQLQSLRNATGVYLNQRELFEGTVWENISMGKENVTMNDIMQVSKKAGLENFVTDLSNGFETRVDPVGKKLADSVSKKILILRALLGEPELLLLEEPWQGLEANEKLSLKKYLFDKNLKSSVIIISNDPESLDQFDLHLQLKNGRANLFNQS